MAAGFAAAASVGDTGAEATARVVVPRRAASNPAGMEIACRAKRMAISSTVKEVFFMATSDAVVGMQARGLALYTVPGNEHHGDQANTERPEA